MLITVFTKRAARLDGMSLTINKSVSVRDMLGRADQSSFSTIYITQKRCVPSKTVKFKLLKASFILFNVPVELPLRFDAVKLRHRNTDECRNCLLYTSRCV